MSATMVFWDDVVVRVRGLGSRLLGRAQLNALAESKGLDALTAAIAATSYGPVPESEEHDAAGIERHTRRAAAERLATIGAWCGERVSALAPLFEDEDRRNLRAIVRGILASLPAAQRTAGLIPTPELPLAPLEMLAKQDDVAHVASLLTAWGNPYGAALAHEAKRVRPDLFLLQLALDRVYAERALERSRELADLREFVQFEIDAANTRSALAVSQRIVERDPESLWVPGGLLLSHEAYSQAAGLEAVAAHDSLSRMLAGTAVAPAVNSNEHNPDLALTASLLPFLKRRTRTHPLSLSVVIEYLLRLRAEVHDLSRIVWGIALDAPRRRITAAFVTPGA